jgi:hypothetical protein
METNDKRLKPSLPDAFLPAKQMFKKVVARYWFQRDKTVKELALFSYILNNFSTFLENEIVQYEQELYNAMENEDNFIALLDMYGKKVIYDDEAKWYQYLDMSVEDYLTITSEKNVEMLQKRQDEIESKRK